MLRGGWGTLAPDAGSAKAGPETVYILASISKPITVLMLMLLVGRGDPLKFLRLGRFACPHQEGTFAAFDANG